MHLKELQTLLYGCITAPDDDGLEARRAYSTALRVIRGDPGLSAGERLRIYIDAYFLRLLGCLKEDFPATLTVVGETQFETLARSYLAEYPPAAPSIDHAGAHFPAFLQGHSILSRFPFLADLARLEQAISEVFVAPDDAALSADDMRNIAPDNWPGVTLRTHPASQLLEFEWQVDGIRRAIENGTVWGSPARATTAIVVWRQREQVYFRELEAAERAAFRVASEGATFATICETLAQRLDDKNPAATINRLLGRWLTDGLLVNSTPRASSTISAPRKVSRIGRKQK